MSFRISARTLLALGAELISSDDVAIYELVKNAIDARSKNGVEIHIHVALSHGGFAQSVQDLEGTSPPSLSEAKTQVINRVEASCEPEILKQLKAEIDGCASIDALRKKLPETYAKTSWIEIRDTGVGMSAGDIVERYLVIGTPARKREVQKAESEFAKKSSDGKGGVTVPYLGEKGVGRLSAMRLGWQFHLESAIESDKVLNQLDIDWRTFENLDIYLEDVKIAPRPNGAKPTANWSGTNIKISGLNGNWSPRRIRDLAISQFARISDPFSLSKRRFRIAIFFNGERVEIPRMDQEILKIAHATVKASYKLDKGAPALDVYMTFRGPEREEDKHLHFERFDISAMMDDADQEVPPYALRTVGPFEFEAYWYNRQKLRGIDSIGDLNAVRDLQKQWSGIMLFRDGYRVLPYGEEKDDWLGLDRRAFASPGYKLNKLQFIGRAQISRLAPVRNRGTADGGAVRLAIPLARTGVPPCQASRLAKPKGRSRLAIGRESADALQKGRRGGSGCSHFRSHAHQLCRKRVIGLAPSFCRLPQVHPDDAMPELCSPLVHQQALREDGECPVWIALSDSQKRVRRNSYIVSIPPFSLGTASGEFLRPATSALLLFRLLPKTLRK